MFALLITSTCSNVNFWRRFFCTTLLYICLGEISLRNNLCQFINDQVEPAESSSVPKNEKWKSSLLTFCEEIFCCFNEYQRKVKISHLSNAHFTKQPLWNNNIFEYKEKSICFKNWINSNFLLLKNMFNNNGELKKMHYFSSGWTDKSILVCENSI